MTESFVAATREAERVATLTGMLEWCRPSGTKSERTFIKNYIAPLGAVADRVGNYSLRIGDAPILWSSHTDSVHRRGGRQKLVRLEGNCMKIGVGSPSSNCLGADDAAGVWLMREMILAKVPGLYVFHRSEEHGGLGSKWIASSTPELVKDIKFAVAFDRRGFDEVITHQGIRCCSDEFAQSLSDQLGMGYKPSDKGLFTDTKQYRAIIGECTNIAVGYNWEHTKHEELDVDFLLSLREKLVNVDINQLVFKRQPGDPDPDWYTRYYDDFDWGTVYGKGTTYYTQGAKAGLPATVNTPSYRSVGTEVGALDDDDLSVDRRHVTMAALVRAHPDEVADWLEEYGIDENELIDAILQRRGSLNKY